MKLISFLKANIRWIAEFRIGWLTIIVLVFSLWFAFFERTSEQHIRFVGMFLQICGLATVALGIRDTRKLFGRPSLTSRIVGWFKRRPSYPRNGIYGVAGNMEVPAPALNVSGYGWDNPMPDASVEDRMSVLEKNLLGVNCRLDNVRELLNTEERNRQVAVEAERREREQQFQEMSKKLESTETGGLDLTFAGLVWIVFGQVLGSIPAELETWTKVLR